MARRALEAEATVVYYDGLAPPEAPANQLAELYDGATQELGGGLFHTAEESYSSRWTELVANIPITA